MLHHKPPHILLLPRNQNLWVPTKFPSLPPKLSFVSKHQSVRSRKCCLGASEAFTSEGCTETLNTECQHSGNKKLALGNYQTKHQECPGSFIIFHVKKGERLHSPSPEAGILRGFSQPVLRGNTRERGPGPAGRGSGLIGLIGGRPAGLQHLLHQVEADARLALVLGDSEVVEQVEVAHVGAVRVAVLVHQPLPLGGVGVPRADVLGLQVL